MIMTLSVQCEGDRDKEAAVKTRLCAVHTGMGLNGSYMADMTEIYRKIPHTDVCFNGSYMAGMIDENIKKVEVDIGTTPLYTIGQQVRGKHYNTITGMGLVDMGSTIIYYQAVGMR